MGNGSTAGLEDRIAVLPNGVDLVHFNANGAPREPDTLVFSGKMSYHANETAVLHLVNEIMPLVWRKRQHVRLMIVGKDPSRAVQALAARHAPLVFVTGTVPDMRPYLQRSALAVVPVPYGAGIPPWHSPSKRLVARLRSVVGDLAEHYTATELGLMVVLEGTVAAAAAVIRAQAGPPTRRECA